MAQSGWRPAGDELVESSTILPMMTAPLKNEDDEKEIWIFSYSGHLYEIQTAGYKEEEAPANHPLEQIKSETDGEDCGGPELTSNPDSNSNLQSNSDRHDSGFSEIKQLSLFGSDKEDNDKSWNDNKAHGSGVNRDVEYNTAKKYLRCSVCNEEFHHQRSLKKHLTRHSEKRYLGCLNNKKCIRVTQNVNMLNRVKTGKKKVRCDVCGKICSRKVDLRRHMKSHTGERPFSCDECGQRFSRKSSVNIHRKIHTGEKPFSCDECGQTFNRRSNIKRHMSIHTGDRPFSCDECGQRFTEKSSVKLHMIIHTGEKPFSCNECGHRFNRKTNLNKHMRMHTGSKQFPSKVCG